MDFETQAEMENELLWQQPHYCDLDWLADDDGSAFVYLKEEEQEDEE